MRGPHLVRAEAEPLGRARTHVVVHHVCPCEETLHRSLQLGVLEVGGERPLARLRGEERPLDAAQRVARDRLDLDHVGAEVGEDPRGIGPGVERAQVEDVQVVQQRAFVGCAGSGRRLLPRRGRRRAPELGEDLVGVLARLRRGPRVRR